MYAARLIAPLALLIVSVFEVAPARAADPVPNATVYEVAETRTLRLTKRAASATIVGTVNEGTPICPSVIADATTHTCNIVIEASDNVDLRTGLGPSSGAFYVTVQDNNAVDGAEQIVIKGSLSEARVDLSPAINDGIPLGTTYGVWSAAGQPGTVVSSLVTEGTYAGIFRLPFDAGGGPSHLVNGAPVPVAPNEHSLGVPTVRLELVFQ